MRSENQPVDVVIITALYDELKALLQIKDDEGDPWQQFEDSRGLPFHRRTFNSNGRKLTVAAAHCSSMGETAAATRAFGLIESLRPRPPALAMCGICAGRRGDVSLGDIIVANRVYSYDHGKLVASVKDGNRKEEMFQDIETYNLHRAWALRVPRFGETWAGSYSLPPFSLDSQIRWFLKVLREKEQNPGAASPDQHPQRPTHCSRWCNVIESLRSEVMPLVSLDSGNFALTDRGRAWVDDELATCGLNVLPQPKQIQVHLGPIATGKTVREDPELFTNLKASSRKVIGVEMEAAAIGWVAEFADLRSIVVKAVSDFGDHEKDDGFRQFACTAAANFAIDFLLEFPPRSLDKTRVDAAIRALGLPGTNLGYARPTSHITFQEHIGETCLETQGETQERSAPKDFRNERRRCYAEARDIVLVHTLRPSDEPGQRFDVFVYLMAHKDGELSGVAKAEFYFGKYWGDKVFLGTRIASDQIGVRTAAYGPFLCVCKVTFTDRKSVFLNRYIDFEMGEVSSRLSQSE
jgi:nucleoside phosphorylase